MAHRVYGTLMDDTDRVEAETALREGAQKYRAILETSIDGFWLTDLQGKLLEVNEAYGNMSGYSVEELLGRKIPDLEGAMDATEVAAKIARVLERGHARFETRHRRQDGTLFDVEVMVQHLPLEGGLLFNFTRDITAVKKAEQEKNQLQEQLTQAHLFEPFFTKKTQGTGLGLATVNGIVKQNKGFIHVYSELGSGSCFKIYLARANQEAESVARKVSPPVTSGGGDRILLVEDEPSILRMTTRMLKALGYQVLAAHTPARAITLVAEHEGAIDLLLTDVVMPEMNGRNLADQILRSRPRIRHLFMSGYTANVIAHHGVLEHGVKFIQKPFSMDGLARKLREVLEA